ncbi:MAG TPA: thiolase family protein [Oligoflexia bacterium]|nr:thiolase family protein [Oligoflexia bacterium]
MNTKKIALIDGLRTPFAKAGTALAKTSAQHLGALVSKELLYRTNITHDIIDEVIFGCVAQPMNAANISRVIALMAGFDENISAYTVARNCASGMQSLASGVDQIQAGHAQIVLAGGTESMSQIPLIFPPSMADWLSILARAKTPLQKLGALTRFRPSMLKPIIGLLEGLKDPFCGLSMGQTAEILANEFNITRQEQDQFALQSHHKTAAAIKSGFYKDEIMPVWLEGQKDLLSQDIGPRPEQTLEALQKLKPYFDRKHGSVTVGNSCPITDGAAAVILASEEAVEKHKLKPLAWIKSYAFAGVDPKRMGLGPVAASSKVLELANMKLSQMDYIEINEAFAAQVLSVLKIFEQPNLAEHIANKDVLDGFKRDRVNVHGGAIAMGHPVGTSGTRIVLTLAKTLQQQNAKYGLASLCIGGGQGGAMIVERA